MDSLLLYCYTFCCAHYLKVFSVGVIVAAAVALGLVQGLPSSFTDDPRTRMEISNATGFNTETLLFNSNLGGGIGIAAAILTIIYEIVVIVLRFLNIGLVNLKIKIFLIIVRPLGCMYTHYS